jgi:hypothetical protein
MRLRLTVGSHCYFVHKSAICEIIGVYLFTESMSVRKRGSDMIGADHHLSIRIRSRI